MDEIRNKIQESGLISLDLAQFRPNQSQIVGIDIAEQLWQGLVLKEKDFRAFISSHDWSQYQGKNVYIFCSADAIVPTWAYMLVASQLISVTACHLVGSQRDLERVLIEQKINQLDLTTFEAGRIIIKGCSDITDPAFAMTCLLAKLQPLAKSIMYGEPCSTVPIYKKAKV